MQQLKNELNIWEYLKKEKNLLAFSAGVDSSALFFLLMENDIEFDMAIVDYNLRKSSKDEVLHAKNLAQKYNKKIFSKNVHLSNSNFESKAREARYTFFEEIIKKNNYNTLITAHHLGDKLEWFFMRLIRGGGAVELSGFSQIEEMQNYSIVRPLIYNSKDELMEYLTCKNIKYFIDESNFDEKYERNFFRKNFAESLLCRYKKGIIKTFEALECDKEKLLPKEYKKIKELYFFKRDENELRLIAKILKFFKIVLSQKQREEILQNDSVVISGKIAVGKNDKFVFIAPYLQNIVMVKEFKEKCRIAKIPLHVRVYMYKKEIAMDKIFYEN